MSRNKNELKMLEMLKEKPEGVYKYEIIERLNVHRDTVNNLYKRLIAQGYQIKGDYKGGKRTYYFLTKEMLNSEFSKNEQKIEHLIKENDRMKKKLNHLSSELYENEVCLINISKANDRIEKKIKNLNSKTHLIDEVFEYNSLL